MSSRTLFQRIRHYGLLSNRHRAESLTRCRELLAMPAPIPAPEPNYRERWQQLTGHDPLQCPQCRNGKMVRIAILRLATQSKDMTAHKLCNSPSHLVWPAPSVAHGITTSVSPVSILIVRRRSRPLGPQYSPASTPAIPTSVPSTHSVPRPNSLIPQTSADPCRHSKHIGF